MSSVVFPVFPGLAWSVSKGPSWKTLVQTASSGKQVALGLWTNPIWKFALKFEYLQANQIYNSIGQVPSSSAILQVAPNLLTNDMFSLAGFINGRMGQYDTWLFDDPTDNVIVQQYLGTAVTGANTQFQAVRQIGEFTETIQNLNGTPTSAPTMWLPSTTYSSGAQVIPSLTGMRTQAGRLFNGMVWQGLGWPNYFAASGSGTLISGANEPYWRSAPYAGATLIDGNITWTNQGVPTIVYTGPTSGSLTAVSPSAYGISSTGLITFSSGLSANTQVYLTSGMYFRCRFDVDEYNFEEFMSRFWNFNKLSFNSVKL